MFYFVEKWGVKMKRLIWAFTVVFVGCGSEMEPGTEFRDCPDCPMMVWIPQGSYMMGGPSGEMYSVDAERPQHRVSIDFPLAVGKYEVTFAQWDACRRAGGCSRDPGDSGWGRGDQPVTEVDWEDAQEYVEWLSRKTDEKYRLLSEAEWEYAARGGTTTSYYWGDDIGRNNANCYGCESRWGGKQTAPVGSFSPNPFGLHDMLGNVLEWTQDCWNESYAGAPTDGSAWEKSDCFRRVVRGGAWDNKPRYLRAAYRGGVMTRVPVNSLGFRVARTD